MQGNPQVIHVLQARLKNEPTAISECLVHQRMCKHRGFEKMARKEHEESIGEVRHADLLMERLFTLWARPNPQHLGKLQIGETLVDALGCDLASEKVARAALKDGMAPTGLSRDHVSQDIFNHVLEDSEVHIDCLEIRFERVGNVGEQNCLRSQMGS